jgi:hypothetical protein
MTADIVALPCISTLRCNPGCSHLFWHCTSCDEKGGEGLPAERLLELADEHNNVDCVAMYEEF